MNKIRKGDEVVVLTGKDKGKRGKVLSRVNEALVVVEGINVSKKHAKPNPMRGVTGGIIDITMPIQQSNLAVVDPKTQKATRTKVATVDGKRVRVTQSGEQLGA
jgi:large subunit ribosomal protein L24